MQVASPPKTTKNFDTFPADLQKLVPKFVRKEVTVTDENAPVLKQKLPKLKPPLLRKPQKLPDRRNHQPPPNKPDLKPIELHLRHLRQLELKLPPFRPLKRKRAKLQLVLKQRHQNLHRIEQLKTRYRNQLLRRQKLGLPPKPVVPPKLPKPLPVPKPLLPKLPKIL